jgi:CHAT domain-containing protein/Tfp pilus assembly protein PilF
MVPAFWLCLLHLEAQPADVQAVNLLAQRLHSAYSLRDQDGILALWSEKSPQRLEQQAALRKLLASGSPSVTEATVGDPEITGDRARVRIDRDVVTTPATAKKKLVLEWVKAQDAWKIWREIPAAEDLAARLTATSTQDEQANLLAKNADLVDASLAAALIDRGRDVRNRGEFNQALRVYELAYGIAERANDGKARALALNNTGLVHYDQGSYAEALDSYRRSLAISQELQDDAGTARSLNNISAVYSDAGEFSAAWENLQKSQALGEKLHDNRLISNAVGNMAIIYGQRGDYLKALSLFNKTYELHAPGGDQRALSIDLINLGNVFLWQGDNAQSQDYFQRALVTANGAGLKPMTAIALMSLGRVAEFRGAYSEAIEKYQQSLAIFSELGDKPFATSDLSFIGSAYSAQGDHAKGLEYYQKAEELQKAMGGGGEMSQTLARMATAYNRKGDFQEAARVAAEAGRLGESMGMREVVWRADLEQGKARRGLGDLVQAETGFAKAIRTIEDLRLDVAGGEGERENYFEDKLEAYHRMLDLLVTDGRDADAFHYAERAKARVLLDVFKNGHRELTDLMTAADRQREQDFRIKLASLNSQLVHGRERLAPPQLTSVTQELNRARLEYDAFETALYTQHPDWKLQSGAIEPVHLDQALEMIPAADTAFVEFVVTDDKLYTFVAAGGPHPGGAPRIRVFTAAVPRAQLTQRVEQFRQQLATRNLGFRASAAGMYRLLFGDAGADLARKRHLILVPDGVLWELPFQALVDPAGRYLLDDCTVSYAPSLTALKAMMEVKTERRRSPERTQLFAMGNPTWGRGEVERVKAAYRDQDLGNLPIAESEVQQLGRIYGEDRSRVYIGRDARESRFKSEAGKASVVHLATHGILNDASPLYSYLLLAGEGDGSREDGLLEARELLQMKLRAELVVLSACETARGRVGAGEGMIGLSWALFVSGVPTTVLSQWKVESDSTSRLMVAFHQNRQKNLSDAESLRAAALAIRKDPAYQHPFYWAPFIVIGAGLN